MSSPITNVKDQAEFDKLLQEAGDKLVVVDFFATWCGPCKMIAPTLEGWASGDFKHVVFLKIDVDECEELAASQEISAMPTFKLFKNGKEVESFTGANADKLKELIKKHA